MENKESLASLFKAHRIWALVVSLMCCVMLGFAQPPGRSFQITAEGTIVDSKTSEPLFAATVKIVSADGGTGTFAITDSVGHFSFEINRPGKYSLEFSYVGYKPLTKEVNVFPGRGAKLGTFKMTEDQTYLKEVETVARNQRVKQKGDTIEYNADAYKVRDGASAEELVAKMPGIEVTDEGVKAQGETVEKLLVDGKSYFENDPKLALKTLPAEVVDRVRVFDKKSDQAEFTGFDDGNTVKAMDLTTKAYRRNGVFGKVYGSLGNNFDFNNPYWNVGTNLNIFSGNRRFSILAMSNNVNQQNFTFDDLQSSGGMGGFMRGGMMGGGGRMGNRMGGQAGVSRANAVSINYNDSYLDDKLTLQGSYSFNNTRTEYHNESQTDNFGVLDSINNTRRYNSSISNTDRLSHNYNHSIDLNISYKPSDRDEFIFRPSLTIQKNDGRSYSNSSSWELALDDVLGLSESARDDRSQMFNYSRSYSLSESTSWNVNGMLTWRHRFDKQGRTLSSMFMGSVSSSDSEGNGINLGSAVRQNEWFRNSLSDQNNWNLMGNLQYTEALGDYSQLSIRYNMSLNKSDRDNQVGFDTSLGLEPDYEYNTYRNRMDSLDAQNTSRYISQNLRQGGEIAYRLRTETVNAMVGLNLEASRLEGEQDNYAWNTKFGQDPSFHTTLNYFSVLPNLRIEWKPWEGGSINMDYRAHTQNPSINNLQETVNTSNPLNYSTGNKNLEQTTSHNIGIRLIHSNMETATNLMVFGNVSFESGRIGSETFVNYSDHELPLTELSSIKSMSAKEQEQYKSLTLRKGARFTRPVNLDGSKSARLNVSYGFPLDLIYSNVNLSMGANYSVSDTRQVYYNSYDSNTGLYSISDFSAKQRNLSLNPNLSITSNISQDLDFSIRYGMSYGKTNNAVNTANNTETLNQNASARLNWTFWKDFTLEQDVTYSYYGGSSLPETIDEWVWNMSLGKKFLKNNAGEVKLQIYDLLNTRTGYSQSVSNYAFSRSYTNYMPRYFMVTFSYKIQNYKSSSDMKQRQGGRGGFGGGFGPRF